MSAHSFIRDLPASPILSDRDHWLFDGEGVDPFVAHCLADAQKHAEELNSDRQTYVVLRFNTHDGPLGSIRDVTEEFWRAAPDYQDEYAEPSRGFHTRAMRRTGAFG